MDAGQRAHTVRDAQQSVPGGFDLSLRAATHFRSWDAGAGTPLPKDDNPQYQQWTFSIQREVPGHGVVEANYVGTKGTHLFFGQGDVVSELDPLAPSYWGMGRNTLTSLVQNPFYGIITNPASTSYNQPTIQLNRLLRPYVAYTSVGGYRASRNIANSIYHAMTIKYEKRFSRGLSVVAHYTISKMMSDSDVSGSDVNFIAGDSSIQDYFNLRNERSLSAFDVPQRLVVSFDYQLPLGRGRTFGKSMNRVLDGVIGGWEVSGIISAASRTPLGITQSASTLWIGSQRPNQIGDPDRAGSGARQVEQLFQREGVLDDRTGSDRLHSALPFQLSRTEPGQRRCHADEELLHQGAEVRATAAGGIWRDELSAVGHAQHQLRQHELRPDHQRGRQSLGSGGRQILFLIRGRGWLLLMGLDVVVHLFQ